MPKGFQKGNQEAKKKGKNKKTIEQEMALSILREEIRKNWDELLQAKLELAKGIWVERRMGKAKAYVYKKEPDSNSLEYLFSMVVGKPKETLSLGFDTPLITDVRIAIIKSKQNGNRDKRDNSIPEDLGSPSEPKE